MTVRTVGHAGGHLPEGHTANECGACQEIAKDNARVFIEQTVLPQLAALRSNVSGLNGVIIPPPWVTEFDRRAAWQPQTSEFDEFTFSHGDLGPQNVLIHPDTLEVCGVVDWENAGFYPEACAGQWAVEMGSYYDFYRDEATFATLISLLGP
ncbi:hypothetical protein CC80DRAFT_551729 [Byssothecium circinans]|uniref:Aminoglycoside phosphotransferase domain-containing protein n=1 Tax=Byssothecium circinans TaxID=147558 RepID=A0A6A5TJJ6_9PLEO|nr:hypothetical protein CC80DRAFT_551729 [Byssothecium circinans]